MSNFYLILDPIYYRYTSESPPNNDPKYRIKSIAWDVACIPDERYTETPVNAYLSSVEKDLSYRLNVITLSTTDYLAGKQPKWFGPHVDRVVLM